MNTLKKIWKFTGSMRFAIALLVLLAAACAVASLVTQNQSYAWYAERYSERTAALIVALHLDDAFHSWWFMLIGGFLCLNLMLCNVLRLPGLIRRTRAEGCPDGLPKGDGDVTVDAIRDPAAVLARLGMPKPAPRTAEDGSPALFSARHRAGLWGAWVCHLGILLLILGFGLGQMTQRQYAVYGVPGQSRAIGDTTRILTFDDFTIDLREDGAAAQYTAAITVRDAATGQEQSAEVSVNHPATLFGMRFYQNSTGWAAKLRVTENGQPLQEEVVCAGEYLSVADKPDLVVFLNAFYPDYALESGVGPYSASNELNNPAYLYSVYYQGQLLGMNALLAGEELTIDEYTVTFSDPQSYTLIQIKQDDFTPLALAGGIVTMLGLLLALYVQPARAWAVQRQDGLWTLHGASRKGGALFRERFLRAAGANTDNQGDDENASG
ncbi:MAG: cytochrome c biogenesis protein ResB [Clostridia bacterium]|nr:cytochrome c biogenesis protein ResB [Clostridia bacterium]